MAFIQVQMVIAITKKYLIYYFCIIRRIPEDLQFFTRRRNSSFYNCAHFCKKNVGP